MTHGRAAIRTMRRARYRRYGIWCAGSPVIGEGADNRDTSGMLKPASRLAFFAGGENQGAIFREVEVL